jgi:hypothetical protein
MQTYKFLILALSMALVGCSMALGRHFWFAGGFAAFACVMIFIHFYRRRPHAGG